eukprot:5869428-Pyramimonas_sp.AAC.1
MSLRRSPLESQTAPLQFEFIGCGGQLSWPRTLLYGAVSVACYSPRESMIFQRPAFPDARAFRMPALCCTTYDALRAS